MKKVLFSLMVIAAAFLPGCGGPEEITAPTPEGVEAGPGVWVVDSGPYKLRKLSFEGRDMGSASSVVYPRAIAVRQADNAVWVVDAYGEDAVLKLSDTGDVLKKVERFGSLYSIAVNETDGACWVGDGRMESVVKMDANGNKIKTVEGIPYPNDLSCYAGDGACWVADSSEDRIIKLKADGSEVFARDLEAPSYVAVDQRDGACWVASKTTLTKFNAAGDLVTTVDAEMTILCMDVNASDGSVVVGGYTGVKKFNSAGEPLWGCFDFYYVYGIAVNDADGSIWISNTHDARVSKYSKDGERLLEVKRVIACPYDITVRN